GVMPSDGGVADAAQPADAGEGDASTGPQVYVHLRATHEPVVHEPGSSGQTPRGWVSGIRSLHLLRESGDPSPVLIFSHGDGFVEASYDDGADTIVGSAPIASLPQESFTWARAVHTHLRFTINATAHAGMFAVPGEIEELVVISDRTTLDGTTYALGDYRWVFRGASMEIPMSGSGLSVRPGAGGGFFWVVERGETAYYFPAVLDTRNDLTDDVHLIFTVNTHESFRWMDETADGYEAGVFDITAAGTEPIVQVGANGFTYTLE
ncbi:MAG: hypothetical protein K8H88_15885, partial [Sandaracinaceae bacterium]|nr:hypothetical protein [Sandaracinaceae bacterium]